MTSITPTANLFTTAGAQHKAQTASRLSAQIKTAVNEVKIADKPYSTEPVKPTLDTATEKISVKDPTSRGLLDPRSAYAITEGGTFFKLVADTTRAAQITPIKVPPPPIDEIMTEKSTMPTPARPTTIEEPYDGGFVITMGPDGTAVCGPLSGPVRWPPLTETEEM